MFSFFPLDMRFGIFVGIVYCGPLANLAPWTLFISISIWTKLGFLAVTPPVKWCICQSSGAQPRHDPLVLQISFTNQCSWHYLLHQWNLWHLSPRANSAKQVPRIISVLVWASEFLYPFTLPFNFLQIN